MWVEKKSRSSGKTYYYNTKTKQTTWKKPADFEDVKQKKAVSDAYATMAENSTEVTRLNTKIIRGWNNKIKRYLIDNHCGAGFGDIKVLDLACGRGGDTGKILRHMCVRRYRGIDISNGAITEAIKRSGVHNKHDAVLDYNVQDITTDTPYNNWNPLGEFPGHPYYTARLIGENYDASEHHFKTINMQYAFHYCCKTKKMATGVLSRIRDSLSSFHGTWIGTVPNAERVRQAIDKKYQLPSFCRITPSKHWKGNGRFGDPYMFYLQDCVPNVEEYLVPKDDLIDLAKRMGLSVKIYMNAGDFLEKETNRRIGNDPNVGRFDYFRGDEEDELNWNVTSLYDVFVFTKDVKEK